MIHFGKVLLKAFSTRCERVTHTREKVSFVRHNTRKRLFHSQSHFRDSFFMENSLRFEHIFRRPFTSLRIIFGFLFLFTDAAEISGTMAARRPMGKQHYS